MDRRSILHVHTLPVISGSGINTVLTMKGSRDRGHRVALACAAEGDLTEVVRKEGMEVYVVESMGREVHPFNDIASIFALKSVIQRGPFDLVHTHNSKAGFVGRLASRMARVPLVVHTVHGFSFHDEESALRKMLFRILERRAARWCHGMIYISSALIEWARAENIGNELPSRVIYSGIDIDAFRAANGVSFRERWGIAPHRLVVGIVSKLWEGKGHRLLLEAWKDLIDGARFARNPLLVIVGEGHLRAELQGLVDEWRLGDTVLFTGFQADVPSVTACLDVSVLPSLFEGMGRVVLEAMAAGKPVIASRVGGIPDLVKDEENGLLIAPGRAAALREALLRVLGDSELRERLGRGARQSVRQEFGASHMVEEIHRFYSELKASRTRARMPAADGGASEIGL